MSPSHLPWRSSTRTPARTSVWTGTSYCQARANVKISHERLRKSLLKNCENSRNFSRIFSFPRGVEFFGGRFFSIFFSFFFSCWNWNNTAKSHKFSNFKTLELSSNRLYLANSLLCLCFNCCVFYFCVCKVRVDFSYFHL